MCAGDEEGDGGRGGGGRGVAELFVVLADLCRCDWKIATTVVGRAMYLKNSCHCVVSSAVIEK